MKRSRIHVFRADDSDAGMVGTAGDVGGGHAATWAYLLPTGAVAALATGTVLDRAWHPAQSLLSSLAWQCTVAAVVFCTTAAAEGDLVPPLETRSSDQPPRSAFLFRNTEWYRPSAV